MIKVYRNTLNFFRNTVINGSRISTPVKQKSRKNILPTMTDLVSLFYWLINNRGFDTFLPDRVYTHQTV